MSVLNERERQLLGNVLFDAVVHPIKWRPSYLMQVETLIELWVERGVERELKRLEEERTNDGC